jgi:hypothetical protein
MAVATAVAIGGLALSAAGTTGSFIQAGKQRKAQAKAQDAASKAMDEARKALEVNYMKALGIQKEPYELQREAMLASGAQITEAARESERGAAAAAGRVQMAQNEAQAGIRTAMGKEMQNIDKLVATEESRLAGERADISLQEAKGAQAAAAYAQNAQNVAMSQAMAGLQSMGQQAQNLIPLYMKQGSRSAPTSYSAETPQGMVSSKEPAPFWTQMVNPFQMGMRPQAPMSADESSIDYYQNDYLFPESFKTP